jgi:hypothetical protein
VRLPRWPGPGRPHPGRVRWAGALERLQGLRRGSIRQSGAAASESRAGEAGIEFCARPQRNGALGATLAPLRSPLMRSSTDPCYGRAGGFSCTVYLQYS